MKQLKYILLLLALILVPVFCTSASGPEVLYGLPEYVWNYFGMRNQAGDPSSPPPSGYLYIYTKTAGVYVENHAGTIVGPLISAAGVTVTPAGSDTQVQFNDSSALGADAGFTFAKTTNTITVGEVGSGGSGDIVLKGNTSGQCTISPAAAAGTGVWTPPKIVFDMSSLALPGSTLPLNFTSAGVLGCAAIDMTTQITGVTPVANGGTNKSSWNNYRYVRTDGSGAITENAVLTANRIPFATTNGILTDDGALSYTNGVLTNTVNNNILPAIYGVNSNTSNGSGGIWGYSTAATGATYGLLGQESSSNNAAYSVYANEEIYLGAHADVAEASAPATPPSGSGRFYWTSTGQFHSIDDSGADRSYADTSQLPKQNAIMAPIGITTLTTAAVLNLSSGTSWILYVGKASSGFTSCTVDLRTLVAATSVTKGVVGVLTGAPPTTVNSTATLTCRGSANYTNSNNTTQSVAVTTSNILTGDDVWVAFYFNGTPGAGQVLGMSTDPLQSGVAQSYTGDFTSMSGTATTACFGNAATPPALRLHVSW